MSHEWKEGELHIIVREGHKRECASNLRINITQGYTSGCIQAGYQPAPVTIQLPPCDCGAEPGDVPQAKEGE
jgi:hypothetical protein